MTTNRNAELYFGIDYNFRPITRVKRRSSFPVIEIQTFTALKFQITMVKIASWIKSSVPKLSC